MARPIRRWLRVLGWLVGCLVVLLLAAAAVSQTAWFRDWLRREIVARTAGAFHGRLAIGALEGDLLSRVTLRDVALTLDGRPVVTIARAEATYDVWGMLVGGGLGLATLDAEGVDLRLVERDGTWNLARALASPEPAEPSTTRFAIDALSVRDLRTRVVRPGARWAVRDAHLAGSLATGPDETTVTLTDAGLRLARHHLDVRELAGALTIGADGRIAVDRLRVRTPGSAITGGVAFVPEGRADVDLDATLAAREIHRLLEIDVPRADLRARIAAHGPTSAVAVDAALHAGDATLTVGGTVNGASEDPSYDLTIGVAALDLAVLLGPDQPETDLHGTVHATASGTSIDVMDGRVVLALHDSTIAGKPLAALDVDARIAGGTVRFTSSARAAAGSLRAEGQVTPARERYDVTLTADRFDPATLLGNPALAGSVAGTLRATGSGFTPATVDATASLALAPSRLGGIALRTAAADVTARAGRLVIDRLVAEGPTLALHADGDLALTDDPAATSGRLAFDATARDVHALAAIAGVTDAAGVVTVRGSANGSLASLGLDAAITGRDLAYAGTRVGRLTATVGATALGSGRGRARVQGIADQVAVASQQLTRATVDASWQQTGGTTSTAHVALDARDDRDRRDVVVADVTIAPAETRVQITTLVVAVDDDTWTAVGQPTVVVRDGGVATEGVLLRSGGASIRVAGAARARGASDLRIEVDGMDLATVQKLAGGGSAASGDERVTGTLAGAATLTGTLAAPRLTVDARLANPTIAGVRYAGASAHVDATASRAGLRARLEQEAGRALSLDVSAPVDLSLSPFRFRATGPIDGRLGADRIDLAFVGVLTSALSDVRGILGADVAIGGTVDRLALRGPVTISDGHARVAATGITYDRIEVALAFAGQGATVERLHLAAGTGMLDGSGDVRLGTSGPELDVRIQLAKFPLFDNADGRGTASGWIWASGPFTAPVVEGALETDRLVLQVPDRSAGDVRPPDPTIEVVGPHAPPPVRPASTNGEGADAEGAPSPSVFDHAAITVQLQVPRNAWIRRSDAEIELRGWMTAWKKPGADLQLSGRIEVVRGWFAFQGKTFDVTEGEVLFTGAGMNPLLRVVAQQRVGDYLARIVLGGTLEKPTLTLESEPALSQADVLSLLIFGKPASELSSGESVGLREQALGVAAGYAASELRQSVAKALGVDTLEFSGGSDLSRAEVSAGKYVARDVFVSLAHRFGEAVQELRIQYYLTPRWTLETSTDTLGRSAVDVFWRRRY